MYEERKNCNIKNLKPPREWSGRVKQGEETWKFEIYKFSFLYEKKKSHKTKRVKGAKAGREQRSIKLL